MKKVIAVVVFAVVSITVMAQSGSARSEIVSTDTADLAIINISPESFPEVSVVFRAERRSGEPLWNLSKEKMRVMENGKPCKVVSLEQISVNKPIALGVVIDHSASMGEDLLLQTHLNATQKTPVSRPAPIDNAKKAVKSFIRSFNPEKDMISVIGFTDSIDKRLPLTQDTIKINEVIESMEPELYTALYDAMIAGLEEIKNADAIRVLVVLTDGHDNASESNWKKVVRQANQENIPIYIIGLGDVNKDSLHLITSSANGRFYFTDSSSSLESIYSEISKQVRAFYDLVYKSSNLSSSDSTRRVELRFDIDSIFLATAPQVSRLPTDILTVLRKKEKRKRNFLYGGIAVAAVIVIGLILFRFDGKSARSGPPLS